MGSDQHAAGFEAGNKNAAATTAAKVFPGSQAG
jgi:hypothetical protein